MANEKTFYQDQVGVRITNTRAIFSNKTYAMANIASVSSDRKPAKRWPFMLITALGVILIAGAGGANGTAVIGILVTFLGVSLWYLIKDDYSVRISSTSGEADAITSKDRAYIEKVVLAMHEAIVARG